MLGWVTWALVVLMVVVAPPARAQQGSPDQPPASEEPAADAAEPMTPTPVANPTPPTLTLAQIADRLRPSVVQVVTSRTKASGVVLDAGVLTAPRAVGGHTSVELITSDGAHISGTVLRTDVSRDLALLSTDVALPAAELEPVANQRAGDDIVVLGYPLGLDGPASLTRGVISAIRLNEQAPETVAGCCQAAAQMPESS